MNTLRSRCRSWLSVRCWRAFAANCQKRGLRQQPFARIPVAAVLIVSGAAAWPDGPRRSDALAHAPSIQPAGTVSGGVYTAAQAERGRQAYGNACTYCHRADLSGNEDGAPALRGPAFQGRWNDRPLSELYFVIKETMPQDEPGSLAAGDCVDIVAYILGRNEAKPGQAELTADRSLLGSIRFSTIVP
jgi:S-disulfanyl-L-cysteine oxidoreductase SoxD